MSTGHEAYYAELTAISYILLLLTCRGDRGRKFTVFTDFRVAMVRVTSGAPGPGQEIAIQVIDLAQRLVDQGNSVTVRWTPAPRGVE